MNRNLVLIQGFISASCYFELYVFLTSFSGPFKTWFYKCKNLFSCLIFILCLHFKLRYFGVMLVVVQMPTVAYENILKLPRWLRVFPLLLVLWVSSSALGTQPWGREQEWFSPSSVSGATAVIAALLSDDLASLSQISWLVLPAGLSRVCLMWTSSCVIWVPETLKNKLARVCKYLSNSCLWHSC